MKAVKVREEIYWVGAIDWSIRNFHGYTTNRGATYNAYLILDEKITLIDTAKAPFGEELLERIRDIIDPEKIDYVISNHVEMDHSGAIPRVMEVCKNAVIVTSAPSGLKGLKAHYGEYPYKAVKAGDTLNIGRRNLAFVPTPMLHWPDNMVTYCPEEKILFSNDAFGQHFASTQRFDDEVDLPTVLQEAQKYYANIIMCYGKQVQGAYEVVSGLDIDMIAPSHGVIWRTHIPEILNAYAKWSKNEPKSGAMVIYDSMWHSTETMARTIAEAFAAKGVPARMYDLKENHISDIVVDVLTSKYIAVGSPVLNKGMMPNVAAFLCYLRGLSPKARKAFAFGSYGWGAQAIDEVQEGLEKCGFDIVLEPLKVQYIPSKEQLQDITSKVSGMVESCVD